MYDAATKNQMSPRDWLDSSDGWGGAEKVDGWSEDEVEDFEEWTRRFEEPIEDSEHDTWLDFMDAEISWGGAVPRS